MNQDVQSPDPIVNGTDQLVQQPDRIGWNSSRGRYVIRTWKAGGVNGKANCLAFAENLIADEIDWEINEEFGISTLSATYGFDPETDPALEAPLVKWEPRTIRVPKELYQTQNVYKYQNKTRFPVTGSIANALLVLRSCVAAHSLTDAAAAGIVFGSLFDKWGDWFQAYDLLVGGTTEVITEQTVLTKVETVSAKFQRSLVTGDEDVIENAGCIFTKAQMIDSEACPELLLEDVELPSGLPGWDPDHPAGEAGVDDIHYAGFHYGYRKSKPELAQQTHNKWSKTTHYEQGIWSMFLYLPADT